MIAPSDLYLGMITNIPPITSATPINGKSQPNDEIAVKRAIKSSGKGSASAYSQKIC